MPSWFVNDCFINDALLKVKLKDRCLLLLISCVNVTNLLLKSHFTRQITLSSCHAVGVRGLRFPTFFKLQNLSTQSPKAVVFEEKYDIIQRHCCIRHIRNDDVIFKVLNTDCNLQR